MFTEVGILCKHCLRVMHACCVANIPEKYIWKRWCKTIEECQSNELRVLHARKEDIQCSSIWKMQKIRKMNTLQQAK